MEVKKIVVAGGGGQMGNGIGQVAAVSGFDVTLVDVSQAALDRGWAGSGRAWPGWSRRASSARTRRRPPAGASRSARTWTRPRRRPTT